jgi:parallel beta-helix repeat protein
VTKSLTIDGEDKDSTILQGSPSFAGIDLDGQSGVTISDLTIRQFGRAISIRNSDGNTITSNNLISNSNGVYLDWSDFNNIYDNTLRHNSNGFQVRDSFENEIKSNAISKCDNGIYLDYSGTYPICKNTISRNIVLSNKYGIRLYNSNDNVLTDNTVHSNTVYGIQLKSSNENEFYYNNIIDNVDQYESEFSTNTWDDGGGIGNVWSDYEGDDLNGDGIGDTDLPHQGVDYYPRMYTFQGDTPTGEDVVVTPTDTTTGDTPVTLKFDEVLEGGVTTLTTSGTGTPPPTGFKLGSPPIYFEITTTAIYEGYIKICIDYSGLTFSVPEENIRLSHLEDKDEDGKLEWNDVTDEDSPDIYNKRICGTISSFSLFAIFEPIDYEPPKILNAIVTPFPAPIGTDITITACLDDSTTGGNIIASAGYKINGVSYPLTPVDGILDEVTEEVIAILPAFNEPGLHTIYIIGMDNAGNFAQGECIFLPINDPSSGFVTGGGWINSPPGAYAADEELTGKASFGFVSKYKKGAKEPTGTTEFQFKAGDLNFHSDDYDWLVVAGKRAQFKGTGTINGEGEYKFILTAIDGDLKGGDGNDKFRIRIWEEDEITKVETIVYDNMPDATVDADPVTTIGGGSIVIHTKGK